MKTKRKPYLLPFIADILAVYVFLAIMAVAFYLYNRNGLGSIEADELPDLCRGFLRFATANICYTFGLYIVFSVAPFSKAFLKKRSYRVIADTLYITAAFAMTATSLSDAVYFHYTGKRFTAMEVFFLDNSNSFMLVLQFLKENWILVITGLLILAVWIRLHVFLAGRSVEFKNKTVHYTVRSAGLVVSVLLIIAGMRGGIDRQTRPITISNAAQYAKTPEKASIVLSNPFCILRTVENKPSYRPHFISDEKADSLFTTRRETAHDSLTFGRQEGKNVVIFIMESFSAEHSAKLYPQLYTESLTPFLDSLMGEGYLMRKAYANGRKSIDALPSVLASVPSMDTPFATMPEALSPTDAIGNYLGEKGYSTWFFNGSERGSMGYVAYARIAGIKNFRTKEDYEKAHGTGDFDGYWGIWDEPFFGYMGETLDSVQQPFLSVLFSLSSHHPFVIPDSYKGKLPQGHTKVHPTVAYVDNAMRNFFYTNREKPWFKNTLFVFVADHVSSERFGPAAETSSGSTHIMEFYFTPDGSLKGEDNRTTQQIDIMPSLAALMGVKRPVHCFGRNIFSPADTLGYAVNYTGSDFQWIQKDTAYIFDGKKVTSAYDLKSDPLQRKNIAATRDSSVDMRIKAFLQTYYTEIREKKFTVSQ